MYLSYNSDVLDTMTSPENRTEDKKKGVQELQGQSYQFREDTSHDNFQLQECRQEFRHILDRSGRWGVIERIE